MKTTVATIREYKNLINGEWVDSSNGEVMERRSPATGEIVSKIAVGTEADVQKAIKVANEAFKNGPWPRMSGMERARVLNRLALLVKENADYLARIEVEEVGKPIRMAKGDIEGCVGLIEYAAGLAQQLHGDTHTNLGTKHTGLVIKEPVGVVGMITPWNFPGLIFCQKMPFALAAGCTIVTNPSVFTSGTTLEISRLAEEAGVPKGVVNIVTGRGGKIGQALVDSPDVHFISFTGSTGVGKEIIERSAKNVKKVSLELGGKGANIVFADSDFEDAIDGALFGIFNNQGEVCVSNSRLIIEDSIADKFLEKLVEKAQKLKVGNPLEADTDMGALIHEKHMQSVLNYIEIGKKEGAKLLTGGERIGTSGYFVQPTIFDQVSRDMRIFQEEIFGPVLSVTRFNTVEEAIELANDSEFGLANAVWTKDLDKALIVSRAIQSGMVYVNTMNDSAVQLPFGGYKASGYGREMGKTAVEEYTEVKSISIHMGKRTPYFNV